MRGVAAFAESKFGPIDVIVNNAGVMPLSPLHELKIDKWNRMIDVNIRGVLHGIAAVLPAMRARKSGHIINICRLAAIRPGLRARFTERRSAIPRASARKYDVRLRLFRQQAESELADTISDETARQSMKDFRQVALTPDAIGRAIAYAIEQPADVNINEIIVRPTAGAQ
jgi:NADP-dependent 3-hydroxy acid dehydrogenase YdfG